MKNATEWAESFIRAGADMAAVNRELEAVFFGPEPEKKAAVRNEFIRLTLANMEVAKRGRQQYAGWVGR